MDASRNAQPSCEPVPAELPRPGTKDLEELVPNWEQRAVYEFLYSRRDDPPTMQEVRDHMAETYEAHEQVDRRLRNLRGNPSYLDVPSKRTPDGRWVYVLAGFRKDVTRGKSRGVSSRDEAEMYARCGQRCAMCGKTPKDDGVKLVVDHIVPQHWGGGDDVDNLQPLCEYHNHGKQAFYSSFDEYASVIRAAIGLDEVHLRIGELLKAMPGQEVPVDLITVVAREENHGDPTRRMRELRALGWSIKAGKRKVGKRTTSFYVLERWEPWPPEGPRKAVSRLEAERKRHKAGLPAEG